MRARCLDAWREWRRPIGFERQRFPSPTSQPPPDAASFSLTAAQMQSLMPSSKLWIILQQSVSSVQWSMYQPQLLRQHYVVGNAMQRHVNFPVVGVSVDQCSVLCAQSAVHSMQLSVHSVHCAEVHMRACKAPSLGDIPVTLSSTSGWQSYYHDADYDEVCHGIGDEEGKF